MKFITKKTKKIHIFLFLLCLTASIGTINAQGTYTPSGGTATLTTQAEVTALGTALDSIGGVTIFNGNLTINEPSTSTDAITDLSVLSNITEIRGSFRVSSAKSLATLSHETSTSGVYAFNALEKITGNFLVGPFEVGAEFTTPWTSLGNFPNLSSVGDNFRIRNNTALEGISADNFPVLATISTGFMIKGNDALSTIEGFPALSSVGGSFEINTNDILTTIGDYPALATIGGTITIQNNAALSNCGDFPTTAIDYVRNAGRTITISDNAAGCGTDATLTTQAEVTALGTALGTATIFIGNITINEATDSTDPITDLSIFSDITEIRGNLTITATKSITSLSHAVSGESGVYAFNALETITGNLNVGSSGNTTTLTNIGNFPNLSNIGGAFIINNNAALTRIESDNFPALVTIGGDFDINNNPLLSTLSGFSVLKTIGGRLFIHSHDALTSLGDYPALTSIGGSFTIGGSEGDLGNVELTTIGDYPALATIGGSITIGNNPKLSNCGGLPARAIEHVRDAGQDVNISTNAGGCGSVILTTQAEVTALDLGAITVFTGNITINEADDSTDPINNLSVFSGITAIRGNLVVTSTKSITTLSHAVSGASGTYAFNALETITGKSCCGYFGYFYQSWDLSQSK